VRRTLAVLPTQLRGFLEKQKDDAEAALRTWDQRGWLLHDEGHLTKKVTFGGRKERCGVIARAAADAVSGESGDPSRGRTDGMGKTQVGQRDGGPHFGAVDPRQIPGGAGPGVLALYAVDHRRSLRPPQMRTPVRLLGAGARVRIGGR
jgi:hypothetical protein